MEQTIVGMERVLFEVREEGDDFELNPKLQNYFENEVKLIEDQIQLIQDTVIKIVESAGEPVRER